MPWHINSGEPGSRRCTTPPTRPPPDHVSAAGPADQEIAAADATQEWSQDGELALPYWLAGRTVVLITHRMASVREADRIYVLDHGEVVEQGDRSSLMSADGIYAQLFTLQASAYQSGRERDTVVPWIR